MKGGRRDRRGVSIMPSVVLAIVLVAGCASNPSTGGTPSPASAGPSATATTWDDLPVATLPGGRFAYGLGGDIWVMDADGSNRRRLTAGPGTDFDPSWSPDGRWILFRTDRGRYRPDTEGVGVEGLFLIRPDGRDEHQIYPPSAALYGALFADWSPDGARIALSTIVRGGETIVVIHADGTHPVDLHANGECADWSPDGRRILFCSRRTGAWNTWIMNADGSDQRQLTTGSNQYPGGWSPDGSRIVVGDGSGGLVVMTPDGTDVQRVALGGGGASASAWDTPEQILVVSAEPGHEPGGEARWGIVRPDGTDLARLPQLDGAAEADYRP